MPPLCSWGFPAGSNDKESAFNARDTNSIPGLERFPGEGNVNLLQYSCLGNSIDIGAFQAIYSSWDCKESDTTEQLTLPLFFLFFHFVYAPCVCVCVHLVSNVWLLQSLILPEHHFNYYTEEDGENFKSLVFIVMFSTSPSHLYNWWK